MQNVNCVAHLNNSAQILTQEEKEESGASEPKENEDQSVRQA